MNIRKNIGDKLRMKRIAKGYTLEKLAESVGVSINYISLLEKNEKANPSDDIIVKLAMMLNIDEDDLFVEYGRIPLSTRKVLMEHPELRKSISFIGNDTKLSLKKREQFLLMVTELYKQMIKKV